MKYQSVKGMDDRLPGAVETWQVLEEKSRQFLEARGFREIRTPVLESTELFTRSIGEASDIVQKEMYTFEDRGHRMLTMRPEMTASVVRSALEHHLIKPGEPLSLYYIGSMYRAERPQAGRKREFHQIGVESLNANSVANDAELIILAKSFFDFLGLNKFQVRLNHLGTEEDRKKYAQKLTEYFSAAKNQLCPDCHFRLTKNVLRIFDCKNEQCRPVIQQAPQIALSKTVQDDFEKIQGMLRKAEVSFRVDSKLVRGLDYYTGCVFEVSAEGLGAQDAVLAGGRYDSLIHSLGGPETGASGFAIGIERLLMALEAQGADLAKEALADTVYVAGLASNDDSCRFYRDIAKQLCLAKKRAHFTFQGGSISSHLSRANKMKVGFTIIVGEDELKAGELTLKNMATGEQKKIKPNELTKTI